MQYKVRRTLPSLVDRWPMAIGAGARDESLRFIEQFDVRNLLIDSIPAASEAWKGAG